ncbi:hypothetical protein INS49_003948 [Diaporthe citri]|uniref:uncharacterized protein n=1 Tax=Diaporthe citri TaxID=83186 RepID=UPI001C806A92|nr:uncharacterized protein INS49_003948 [Diaporthe citri]KAG6354867.1 hypothetical protein INS49_003948 [Diaporthe citri]
MSPEDLGYQLNAAYLDKLVNHTLTQLDQVVRDREDQTPDVEFDGEHPTHSFKFECEQISAWFQDEEVNTLRETIQDSHYWAAEAHALVELLLDQLQKSLTFSFEGVFDKIEFISDELAVDEMDAVYEQMTRISQYAEGVTTQLRAKIQIKWASENAARTASQWQENVRLLHHVSQELGLRSKHIQQARQGITDERYWQSTATSSAAASSSVTEAGIISTINQSAESSHASAPQESVPDETARG